MVLAIAKSVPTQATESLPQKNIPPKKIFPRMYKKIPE